MSKTLRDIAEDISREFGSEFELDRRELTNAIELALRSRDERAAKMVLERRWMFDHELAKAIREGK